MVFCLLGNLNQISHLWSIFSLLSNAAAEFIVSIKFCLSINRNYCLSCGFFYVISIV